MHWVVLLSDRLLKCFESILYCYKLWRLGTSLFRRYLLGPRIETGEKDGSDTGSYQGWWRIHQGGYHWDNRFPDDKGIGICEICTSNAWYLLEINLRRFLFLFHVVLLLLKDYNLEKSLDEASSSGSNKHINHRSPEIARKTKNYIHKSHRIPMLGSDNIVLDRTPNRKKTDKKGSYIVEIVDIKCRNPDRAWATPITNRLKKLSFSKLSESVV
ncbi:hypothetical protein L1049_000930 [Liquidambar formosana]|uniref:Uncharacterized protein n=1 Tax=Liquidambar formosana TaxID=63359 RepID=A0AAP0R816_LIQFO